MIKCFDVWSLYTKTCGDSTSGSVIKVAKYYALFKKIYSQADFYVEWSETAMSSQNFTIHQSKETFKNAARLSKSPT